MNVLLYIYGIDREGEDMFLASVVRESCAPTESAPTSKLATKTLIVTALRE